MISHKYKFIYIKVAKTGSQTIIQTLRNHVHDLVLETYRKHYIKNFDFDPHHISSFDIQKKLPNEFDQYFKFAFARNPWDRLVSIWSMNKLRRNFKCTFPLHIPDFPEFIKSLYSLDWMPKENIYRGCNKKYFNYTFGNVSDFAKESNFIGKIENFEKDFKYVCDKIGIPRQELPRRNKTNHKHYTEYYDDETREIVAEKYAKDIENFGYEFGE